MQLLSDQPNTVAPVVAFQGLWLRNKTNEFTPRGRPVPDDDTQLFLGCRAKPPSTLVCPGTAYNAADPAQAGVWPPADNSQYDGVSGANAPGKDWMLVNGALQPDIPLVAGRWVGIWAWACLA